MTRPTGRGLAVFALLLAAGVCGLVVVGTRTGMGRDWSPGATPDHGAEHSWLAPGLDRPESLDLSAASTPRTAAESSWHAATAAASGSLELVVTDAAGSPVPDLPFVLFSERPKDHPIEFGHTDDRGRARFRRLPENLYLIGTLRSPPFAEGHGGAWLGEGESATLRVVVDSGGAVEGRVTDDLGRPMEGLALVPTPKSRAADFWEKRFGSRDVHPSITDAEGRYRVEALRSEPRGVWIVDGEARPEHWEPAAIHLDAGPERPGRASAQVASGETVHLDDIVLRRRATYAGVVVDQRGDPIADALVSPRFERPGQVRFVHEQDPERRRFEFGPGVDGFELFEGEALTDAFGRFEVAWTRPRKLTAWTPDGRLGELDLPRAGSGERLDDLEIVIDDATVLTIELLDESGERLMGRHERLWRRDRLIVEGNPFGYTMVQVGSELATDAKAEPGAAARLPNLDSHPRDGLFWESHRTTHDGDGRVRIALPIGTYPRVVNVHVPGYESASGTVDPATRIARIETRPSSTITVRLVASSEWKDAARFAAPYYWLRLCSLDPGDTATDHSPFGGCGLGTAAPWVRPHELPEVWEFPVLDTRPFWLLIGRQMSAVASFGPFDVGAPGVHEVELPLGILDPDAPAVFDPATKSPPAPNAPGSERARPQGQIAFRAIDAVTGEALQYASLHLDSTTDASAWLLTGSDGRAEQSDVSPGTYSGRLERSGYRPLDDIRVVVRDGGVIDLGTLELEPVPALSGRVIDAAGSPVEGAGVSLGSGFFGVDTRTDSAGRFQLETASEPPFVLSVVDAGGGVHPVCVREPSESLEIRLHATHSIVVRVTSDDLVHETVNIAAFALACPDQDEDDAVRVSADSLGPPRDGEKSFQLRLAAGRWRIFGFARRGTLEDLDVVVEGDATYELALQPR